MRFAIHCTFAPGAFANAKSRRLEHYAFLREARGVIVEGGPLLGSDGIPTGMLMVIEAESEESARGFIALEPYNANGFFDSVVIRGWSRVIPEPTDGFIENEYQKEFRLRHSAS